MPLPLGARPGPPGPGVRKLWAASRIGQVVCLQKGRFQLRVHQTSTWTRLVSDWNEPLVTLLNYNSVASGMHLHLPRRELTLARRISYHCGEDSSRALRRLTPVAPLRMQSTKFWRVRQALTRRKTRSVFHRDQYRLVDRSQYAPVAHTASHNTARQAWEPETRMRAYSTHHLKLRSSGTT